MYVRGILIVRATLPATRTVSNHTSQTARVDLPHIPTLPTHYAPSRTHDTCSYYHQISLPTAPASHPLYPLPIVIHQLSLSSPVTQLGTLQRPQHKLPKTKKTYTPSPTHTPYKSAYPTTTKNQKTLPHNTFLPLHVLSGIN